MDLLLGEVNDDLRRDRFLKLWKRGRRPLFYAAILLVIGTAASSIYDYFREQKAQAAMDQLTIGRAAFNKGDYATASKAFNALAAETSGDLNDMARLWQARSFAGQGKKDEAVTTLIALAEKPAGSDLLWRDLACLRLEGLAAAKVPKTCGDTGDSPLKMQRNEWRVAQLVEQGKVEEARSLLKTIIVGAVQNSSERQRAQALLTSLGEGK